MFRMQHGFHDWLAGAPQGGLGWTLGRDLLQYELMTVVWLEP